MHDTPFSQPTTDCSATTALAHLCYVVLGIAYTLGEGVPAALDVLMRVALLEEGWRAAAFLYLYPVYIAGVFVATKTFRPFPWSR